MIQCIVEQRRALGGPAQKMIQWQRYWDDAPYPDIVKLIPHVAFEVDDLNAALVGQFIFTLTPNVHFVANGQNLLLKIKKRPR